MCTGDDFPHRTLTGRVTEVSPLAVRTSDNATTSRTVPVTIAIDGTPAFLRDGMTVDVNILTTQLAGASARAGYAREGAS